MTRLSPETTQVSLKIGGIVSTVTFIVWATFAVSTFMHEMRGFNLFAKTALEENKADHTRIGIITETLTNRQNGVLADRWKFSDQLQWSYRLEQANREIVRDPGKGLIVPEPVKSGP